MSEHLERLEAMRDDQGLTWDLSGRDRAAFAWAVQHIHELEAFLAAYDAWTNDNRHGAWEAMLKARDALEGE